ncbi:MAG: hypothetical protein AAFQ80_24090 [Cyanobacteria bacterium J06621_8]
MNDNKTELESLLYQAEDELLIYSSDNRKVERLRRKIGISYTPAQQKQIKQELQGIMPQNFISRLVEQQRHMVSLPFWGIGGLGLLLGISFRQPVDFLATAIAIPLAINIQKWGWHLEAQRILLRALEEIENRMKQPVKD